MMGIEFLTYCLSSLHKKGVQDGLKKMVHLVCGLLYMVTRKGSVIAQLRTVYLAL